MEDEVGGCRKACGGGIRYIYTTSSPDALVDLTVSCLPCCAFHGRSARNGRSEEVSVFEDAL